MDEFRPLAMEQIARRGNIRAADVRRIENLFFQNGGIDRQEAEMLFSLHDAARVQDPAWLDFFIRAIADHIVNRAEPQGYLNGDNADWLMRWISSDGHVASRVELDLAIAVLEQARWAPVQLAIFALDQVRYAVVNGTGPLRAGMEYVAPGTITAADVAAIKRILRAYGHETGLAITRAEADALFDIEAASESDPAPEWTDLLVRATAHGLLDGAGVGCAARGLAFAEGSQASDLICHEGREQRALARLERQRLEIVTGDILHACDAGWLASRMGEFADLSLREQVLLARLEQAGAEVVAVLRDQGVEFAEPEGVAA